MNEEGKLPQQKIQIEKLDKSYEVISSHVTTEQHKKVYPLSKIICYILILLFYANALILLCKLAQHQQKSEQHHMQINIKQAEPKIQKIQTTLKYINKSKQVNPTPIDYLITQQRKDQFMKYRILKDIPQDQLAQQQFDYYNNRYNIAKYQKQLPFCIVTTSYNDNHHNLINNNLNSIFNQDYSNYHVVYFDDASNDGTYDAVIDYINTRPAIKDKIVVYKNQINQKSLVSLVKAAHNDCKPEQIFLIVDGDDQLVGRQVLQLFNSVFQEKKAYFIYTNFIDSHIGVGYSNAHQPWVKQQNKYRQALWKTGHLQGFYTELLRRIKDQDLRDHQGHYFISAQDVVVCIPILQMSHLKVEYLPQLTYYWNSQTGINDHTIRLYVQSQTEKIIRTYPQYQEVKDWSPQIQLLKRYTNQQNQIIKDNHI